MEGHVVFRQGERTIYADRMYYNVRHNLGTVLGADVLTPAPGYEGKVRLHANVLQQIDVGRFSARAVGHFQPPGNSPLSPADEQRHVQRPPDPALDPISGEPLLDPKTGQPLVDHQELVEAQNNFLYIESVPVFYWPTFATDLNDPSFFLRRVQYKDDGVFGEQFYTDWAVYQLLGIKNRPEGTDWTLNLNYLSYRGFSEGTEFEYNRDNFWAFPARWGKINFWGISDRGKDNLGYGRTRSCPNPTSTIATGSWNSIARNWAEALPSRPRWARSAIATSCWSISSKIGTSRRTPAPTWN